VVCNGIRGRVFAYARVHVHRRLVGAIAIAAASRARPGRIIGKHLAIGERTPFLIHSPPSRSRFILRTRIARKSRKCARAIEINSGMMRVMSGEFTRVSPRGRKSECSANFANYESAMHQATVGGFYGARNRHRLINYPKDRKREARRERDHVSRS